MENKHVVYILECKDGTLYTGYTNNLMRRLAMHKAGKGAKYTRGRGPLKLRYYQEYVSKQAAMQAEYEMKQLNRLEKLKRIRAFEEKEGYDADTEKF